MPSSDKKLKILFTQRFSFGGGLISTHYMCNHLVGLGHEVVCIYIKNKLAQEEPPALNNPKYRVIWLKSLSLVYIWTLIRFLRSYLKNNKIDVIISTGPEGSYLKSLCSKNSIFHIASYHHPNPTYVDEKIFTPKLKYLNPKNIGKWLHRCDSYFERLSLLRADVVHCLSQYQKKITHKILGIPKDKIVVIYCGVDTKKFSLNQSKKKPRILYCSGFVPSKGIDTLLRALSIVVKKYNNVVLDILGGGKREPYIQTIADLGIAENIRYYGHIPYDEINKYYRNAYLFVAPTKHESFGLTIGEAMASGLPVVSTSATAIPEIVQDKITGFLVPWKDSRALAEAIITLLSNPEMAKSMGKAGRKRVEEMFTWQKTALQLEKLIIKHLSLENN
ncbi:glycosyltransferase family 4 protein [Patescibacteria group bacterium]|nr:glycosyltransferase family 4 protein [Patescibacteria group bacterium]